MGGAEHWNHTWRLRAFFFFPALMSADPTAVTLTIPTLSTHPVLGDPPPAVLANSVAVDLITVSAFASLATNSAASTTLLNAGSTCWELKDYNSCTQASQASTALTWWNVSNLFHIAFI